MLRDLRAFAWLRWRVLMNAFERSGKRDALERLSRATEQIGPILLFLLFVPGAFALGALGLFAGRAMARADVAAGATLALRLTLAVLFLTALLGPLLFPVARQPRNLVRLLLLPIPTRVLFALETASGAADPWIAVAAGPLLTVPIGLVWGGRPLAAAIACVSGAVLFALILGSACLASTLFHLAVRDRRRSELIAIALVCLPLVFAVVDATRGEDGRAARRSGDAAPRTEVDRAWIRSPIGSPAPYFPTELYTVTQLGVGREPATTLGALAVLIGLAVGVHALSWRAYRRLLAGPAGAAGRVARRVGRAWGRLPGLTGEASAIARAELRLVTRTPRGRLALAAPLFVSAVLALPAFLRGDGSSFGLVAGAFFAMLAAAFGLLGVGPIALNQFATDGPGLTLELLAPVEARDVLAGKAWALGLLALGPAVTAQAIILALFRDAPPGLALAAPIATLAGALALAPVWALLSAVFPRTANLNAIGSGGNPHGLANLLGGLALVAALAPPVGLSLAAVHGLDRPNLAAALVAIWCAVAWGIGRLLMSPAAAAFRARRENLAMVAMGR